VVVSSFERGDRCGHFGTSCVLVVAVLAEWQWFENGSGEKKLWWMW
jgi:hypothetical protein